MPKLTVCWCAVQVAKWDEQREAGNFPAKLN